MRVVILGNGAWENPDYFLSLLKKSDLLVACNGAYGRARKKGLRPQILIGDMDSLKATDRKTDPRLRIFSFPAEKDQTDGELALQLALRQRPSEILWYAALGNRWDQSFVNAFLLAQAAKRKVPVRIIQGRWSIYLVLKSMVLEGNKRERISLLALSRKVEGITLEGLKYPLCNATLFQHSSLGVSNEMISRECRVSIRKGWLLLFHEKD